MHSCRGHLTKIDSLDCDVFLALLSLFLHGRLIPFSTFVGSLVSTQQAFPLSRFHRSGDSRFALDLGHFVHRLSTRHAASATLPGLLVLPDGFLQQSFGFVDLVLHQVQLRASTHLSVGVKRCLVDDDGSTELARGSLSRAMGPGLDQVTTSFRWNTVVDARGLLLYQQYLEVLWHRRSRGGGCCAFIRFTIGFSVDVVNLWWHAVRC